jgi:CheY-like chemotaxis protein
LLAHCRRNAEEAWILLSLSAMKPCVLVVDDDADIRETLEIIFEANGYGVAKASNGQEALDLLATMPDRPCLILLDLMMPVLDGWSFFEAAQKNIDLANIPVVAITAFSDVEKVKPVPIKRILKKPLDVPQLVSVIKEYCH